MSGDDSSNEKASACVSSGYVIYPHLRDIYMLMRRFDVVGRALEPMIWGRTQVWHELPFVCSKKGGKLKKIRT